MEIIEHVPKVCGMRPGAEKFPALVVLSMANFCNARCVHCVHEQFPITRQRVKHVPHMPSELFKKIAAEVGARKGKIRLSGKGEPLLNHDFVSLVQYAQTVGAWLGLITNGSKLYPKTSEAIIDAEIGTIEVSIDAADKETFSKIRVGLDFDEIHENLLHAIKYRNKVKGSTKIMVSIIDQQLLNGKLDTAVKYWENIVDFVIVRKYLTYGKLSDESSGEAFIQDQSPCPFPFERLVIEATGNIPLCGYDLDGKTCIGNAWDNTIEDIWLGKELTELREKFLSHTAHEVPLCASCTDWKYRSWDYNYFRSLREAEKTKQLRI